ncbi:hypothetical protein LABALGNA3A7_05370 [Dellaglioa algida]|nr:hypothetical protein LABALGNA3A7_05370 [Dellaglioa algida]
MKKYEIIGKIASAELEYNNIQKQVTYLTLEIHSIDSETIEWRVLDRRLSALKSYGECLLRMFDFYVDQLQKMDEIISIEEVKE